MYRWEISSSGSVYDWYINPKVRGSNPMLFCGVAFFHFFLNNYYLLAFIFLKVSSSFKSYFLFCRFKICLSFVLTLLNFVHISKLTVLHEPTWGIVRKTGKKSLIPCILHCHHRMAASNRIPVIHWNSPTTHDVLAVIKLYCVIQY